MAAVSELWKRVLHLPALLDLKVDKDWAVRTSLPWSARPVAQFIVGQNPRRGLKPPKIQTEADWAPVSRLAIWLLVGCRHDGAARLFAARRLFWFSSSATGREWSLAQGAGAPGQATASATAAAAAAPHPTQPLSAAGPAACVDAPPTNVNNPAARNTGTALLRHFRFEACFAKVCIGFRQK